MSAELAYLAERLSPPGPDGNAVAPGSEHRFERIVQRHHARLRRVATGILGGPDRVDDVLQDAYLKAYRRLPRRFSNEAHESAWLYRIVFRCCLDELRRTGRRREQPGASAEHLRAAEDRVERLDVDRAFRRLSVEDRSVLLLVDLVGLDYEAAARVLKIKRGTVASRLNHARRRFRDALVHEGVVDAGE
jgi:RNA polymerase sigma-70 factor, ECF subfamily